MIDLDLGLVQLVEEFFYSSRRRNTRFDCDWSSDMCSSDLGPRGCEERSGGSRAQEEKARSFCLVIAREAKQSRPARQPILPMPKNKEVRIRGFWIASL